MPDVGGFNSNMPERDNNRHAGGIGWGEAFAALPQESPDAGGWQRVQARLPVPAPAHAHARWPLWLATAASLLLAVAIPLRMLPQGGSAASDISTRHSGAGRSPALAVQASGQTQRLDHGVRRDDGMIAAAPVLADVQPVSTPVANRDRPHHVAPSQRPIRTVAEPAGTTRIAATDASATVDLEPLYAQSAQLEALLALARDERVASGPSAALSDELDARVADIDAALIQSGLGDAQRTELWGRRVDALQQLVGIEATNRLYAARGQRYDAALVSID